MLLRAVCLVVVGLTFVRVSEGHLFTDGGGYDEELQRFIDAQRERQRALELAYYTELKNYGAMMLCLQRGDNPDNVDPHGKTALYYLAKYGEIEFAMYLLNAGADINSRTPSQSTPLMIAASAGKTDMVCFLLRHGADKTLQNDEGKNAQSFATDEFTSCIIENALGYLDPCSLLGQEYCQNRIATAEREREGEVTNWASRLSLLEQYSSVGRNLLAVEEAVQQGAPKVRVMSYNIMYDNQNLRKKALKWMNRLTKISNQIRSADVDFAGLQEVQHHQLEHLREALPEYSVVGVGRDDGAEGGEYNPILFHSGRYAAVGNGTFWLSETPLEAGSVGWDADLPRIVTWVRLARVGAAAAPGDGALYVATQERDVVVMNTHFDHAGPVSREESAGVLLRAVAQLEGVAVADGSLGFGGADEVGGAADLAGAADCEPEFPPHLPATGAASRPLVLITGDFNEEAGAAAYQQLSSGVRHTDPTTGKETVVPLRESREVAIQKPFGPPHSFTGLRSEFRKNIDFVWVTGAVQCPYAVQADCASQVLLDLPPVRPQESPLAFVLRSTVVPQEWTDKTIASDHAAVLADIVYL